MKLNNILIIGMSKMGKTHFGGQLYGRLKSGNSVFKLRETPSDLALFEDILENLNQGLEGKHTDAKLNKTISLPIVSDKGKKLDIIYPDYGGEQLRGLLEQRKISPEWHSQIINSNHWFLFIRLDLLEDIADVTTKFYQLIEEEKEVATVPRANITELPEESSAFYIELIQTFLSVKKVSLTAKTKPNLTILLSCWDKLGCSKGTKPGEVLKIKIPIFFNFIDSIWPNNQLHIIGLSSLGKDLNSKNPDLDYTIEGPENYGYVVLENGEEEMDLTVILNSVSAC